MLNSIEIKENTSILW